MTGSPALVPRVWRIVSLCGIFVGVSDLAYSLLLKKTEPWNMHLPISRSYDHHLLPLAVVVLLLSITVVKIRTIDIRLRASIVWSGCLLVMWMRHIHSFPARIDFLSILMLSAFIAAISVLDWLLSSLASNSKTH